MQSAIAREKAIKEWKRAWKIELIEKTSPQWLDLYGDLHSPDVVTKWVQFGKTGFRLSPE